jgi:metallophosphoesterase (TIGR00282 family)
MHVLFIGDIIGRTGRKCISHFFPKIKEEFNVDFTIANVENAAGGFGIIPKLADELLSSGIDVLTSGNHIWNKKEIIEYIAQEKRLLRPANYPPDVPGKGTVVINSENGYTIAVMNLCGRVFMSPLDCPFRVAEMELAALKEKTNIIILDFHAEATSEKIAMGWFLDGKISAVIGTHTHVQTNDAQILPQGTAYITDVGMTGPFDSVIGIKKEIILERFINQIPYRLIPANSDPRLSAVLLDIDDKNGKTLSIRTIQKLIKE